MKRIGLAVLIDVLIAGVMILILVFPVKDIPVLQNALQSVLCQPGETVRVEQYSTIGSDDDVNHKANFYCRSAEGPERSVTERATILLSLAFVIPFVISMVLYFSGGSSMKHKHGWSEDDSESAIGAPRTSATERFRELKYAYEQGLISEVEYQAKRQGILREI